MATKSEEFFHEKWLGMVQGDSDGLVVAKPILLDAGCANHQRPEKQDTLRELCPVGQEAAPRHIADVMQFFEELLGLDVSLFDSASAIADEVSLYAPEGPQTIRPTFGLLQQGEPEPQEGSGTPASNAAAKYVALLWDVTEIEGEHNADAIGLPLDKPETTTGEWSYPAAAKFDRLLRHCRVPVGILTNREVIRLVYAPHGESSGHITFRVDDMAMVGGRPILDAMIMLLCANQWFGVSDKNSLPSLLRRSREYQGTVTTDLAEQVFSGLEQLLKGFQTAAERDQSGLLREALHRDEDHLYRGLLTVMLRMVFILYAEDRGLLPVDHPIYAKRMSLLGLFERLQRDHGNYPDSMNNRFGAWGHLISLFRTIYLGVEHGDFHIPARQGDLFDPHTYPFLEGWNGPSAPIVLQTARAEVKVPTVDDGTVFALLQRLLIFQGQRLSYRTLDVEQIGSVYEALMGYRVSPCESSAVAIKISSKRGAAKYWVEPEAVLARPAGQRVKWLKDECGFDKPVATKIKKALDDIGTEKAGNQNAAIEALLPLAAGKKALTHKQRASIGQYVLQPGTERRRSGTNYTPRSMTEPIVRKTLEPLIRCLGEESPADQLLELKICDPAMGSGAFLVECCRQLADEVVAAWGRAHEVENIAAECPEGDVVAHARRLVAQRCLYGVDKNPMAVPLAKLSLWLFTLARDLPFTFLDHSLRHGDSLVGLDLGQVRAFHWKPVKQLTFVEIEIKRALGEVVAIRKDIHQLAGDSTPAGQKLKAQRLFDANDATEKLRKVADICVGAFFAEDKDNARVEALQVRGELVRAWLGGDADSGSLLEESAGEIRKRHSPFHWWLEFPEVFYEERPDPLSRDGGFGKAYVDAFVGNPPYAGKNTITDASGKAYLAWLKVLHEGAHGNADLSAHFLRRAANLLGMHGVFGLIATKTIAEGDTRDAGLKALVKSKWRIFDATRSLTWPGAAAVTVSVVHAAKGNPAREVRVFLDEAETEFINSRLRPSPEREDPSPLRANTGKCYQGTNILGPGFILTASDRCDLLASSPANAERISPYLGGENINNSPTQSFDRWVINFEGMALAEAAQWPDLLKIAEDRVKPQRATDKRPKRRDGWWQFGERSPGLHEALLAITRCIVTVGISKHRTFALQPADRVWTHNLYVFPLESMTAAGVLQSRVHVLWTLLLASGRDERTGYRPTDCFITFPFPESDPDQAIDNVERASENLYDRRSQFLIESNQGLTSAYNAIMNPDCEDPRVAELRSLHEQLDRVVLAAYGWPDIDVPPYCPRNAEEEAAIEGFSDCVIDRLFVLNAKRVAEEEARTPSKNSTKQRRAKKSASKKSSDTGATKSLPGMGDPEGVS